ncbi:MAG: M4 family metallopeptidase [Chitinophagaceae bacterium]
MQCIIPPYIAEKLSKKTQNRGEEIPDDNLAADKRIREKRKNTKPVISAVRSGPGDDKMKMKVFDAGQLPILPGDQVWQQGEPLDALTDKSVKEVISGGTDTWNFFKKVFKRNSLDNNGVPLVHSVHFRENPTKVYGNAFWNGGQMIYGDGDGINFASFTSDIDIIAHELTHGIVSFEADLEYKDQSGALNESFADVFGILVKQWATKTPAKKSSWLIGENILIGDNYALRSMKAPGTAYTNHPFLDNDPQPAVMSDFIKMKDDDGGVHFNSGIPNHAFYVTAIELGGNAWEKAGRIWYATLTDRQALKKKATFSDARKATIQKAIELFGDKTKEVKAVIKGWDEAEVK